MSPPDPLSVVAVAHEAPDRILMATDEGTWTVAETARAIAVRQRWLAQHAGPADRPVALEARATVETALWVLALIEAGRPLVPLHPQLTAPERAAVLEDSGAELVTLTVGEEGHGNERSIWPAAIDPEAPLAIVYTSGTSGRAKGAVLSRRAFVASARASRENLGRRADDRWLLALPPAHVGGLTILVRAIVDGSVVVLGGGGRFDAHALAATIARHRVTLLSLVPTMLRRLLDADVVLAPSVRAILLGGAAAPPALLRAAAARGMPILTTYGLTEACSQVATQAYGTPPRDDGSCGRPLPGTTVRITDGRILVRGPTLFSGYHPVGGRPSPFDAEGFFDTGDEGAIDGEGCLHVLGRRTDLIVVGGENVYPAEIERGVLEVPGVADACVFGVPDAEWGERVALAVVVAGEGPPALETIVTILSTRLARYKLPTLGACVATLPYRGIGKLDRRAVAATVAGALRPIGRTAS